MWRGKKPTDTVGTFSKSNIKNLERSKTVTLYTQSYIDRSLSWFGTDTSINRGGVKLVLWP